MRLQHYLTEGYKSISENEINALIAKDCKPYLKQIKNEYLYRGMKSDFDAFKAVPRKNRMPKDTPIVMHNLFDDIIQKLYAWKPRSQGVFATGGKNQAGIYGSIYKIYPIGNFKFLWAPTIHDFYVDIKDEFINLYRHQRGLPRIMGYDDIIDKPAFIAEFSTFIKKSYTDKDLYKAAQSEHEVMILCKSYYAKWYNL